MWILIVAAALVVASGQVSREEHLLMSAAASDFSDILIDKITLDKPNFIFSPLSIHSTLTMVMYGARGDTAKELSDVLGLSSMPKPVPHHAYHDLLEQLIKSSDVSIKPANAIYFGGQESVKTDFAEEVTRNYFSFMSLLDLETPEKALQAVNDDVANETNGNIKNILVPGDVDNDTVVLLVSAPFINGSWEQKFYSLKTYPHVFYLSNDTEIQINMMSDVRRVFIKCDYNIHTDVLELPLQGGRLLFYIVLPHDKDGVPALETHLSLNHETAALFKGLKKMLVRVGIPKFKISTRFDLKAALQDLGLEKSFDKQAADFTGIDDQGGIVLSNFIHQAYIDVNEEGTVDSAADPSKVSTFMGFVPPEHTFIADHPFLFFLVDNTTGQILLRGKFSG